MKTKNKKKFLQADWEAKIYFGGILAIAFLVAYSSLFFTLSLVKNGHLRLNNGSVVKIVKTELSQKDVAVRTDKNIYNRNEKINFSVINNSDKAIYVEPCEYLANYEKKVGGKWVGVESSNQQEKYNPSSFNKKDKEIVCSADLPRSEGVFRAAVDIYSDCKRAGADFCRESKRFYSDEFEVRNATMGCGCGK